MNKDQRVEGLFIIEEMWQWSKPVEFEGVSSFIPSISDQFWIRLVHIFLLHLIIKAYYLKFLRMKKRNSFIKTDRNVEDIEMISNDYRIKDCYHLLLIWYTAVSVTPLMQ